MPEPQIPIDGPQNPPHGKPKRSRWRRRLALAFLLIVGIIIGLWCLPSPNTTDKPVTYTRNPDGSYSSTAEDPGDSTLSIHAAKIEARNNSSRASSSVHSGADFLAARSITVINLSDSLLMKRAADELVSELKKNGNFESVTHLPAGFTPERGSLKSDLYLTLDLTKQHSAGVAPSRLEADIVVQFGPSPISSNHSYSSSLSQPILEFHSRMQLEHRSELTGLESSGAKFKLQGDNIGQAIAKGILGELADKRKEEKTLPNLPSGFHPDWVPAPEFSFLTEFSAEEFLSFSGCCLFNETLWHIEDLPSADPLFDSAYSELKELGWQGSRESAAQRYLRMTDGAESLELFPVKSDGQLSAPSDSEYWVRYRRVLNRNEQQDLFGQMLSESPPRTSTLLELQRLASSAQRNTLMDLVETAPPSTASAWLGLANRYLKNEEQEKAIAALQCAKLIDRVTADRFSGQINSLIKKHKLDSKLMEPNEQTFAKLGIPRFTDASSDFTIPISGESLTAVYTTNEQGQYEVDGLKLTPSASGTNAEFEVVAFSVAPSTYSRSTQSLLREREFRHNFHSNGNIIEFLIDKDDRSQVVVKGIGPRSTEDSK